MAHGNSENESAVAGQIRDIIAALHEIRAQLADQNKYLDVLTEKYIHRPSPSQQVYFLDEDVNEGWDHEEEEEDDDDDEYGPLTPESVQYSRKSDKSRFRESSIEYRSDETFRETDFGHSEDFTPIRRLLDPFTMDQDEDRNTYFDCLARPIVYGEDDAESTNGLEHDRSRRFSAARSIRALERVQRHETSPDRLTTEEVKGLRHSLSTSTPVRPLVRRNSLAELTSHRNRYILVFVVATGFSLPIGCVANSFGIRPCIPNHGPAAQWPFMARFLVLFVVTYFTTATCALWFVREGELGQDVLGSWRPRRMTAGGSFARKVLTRGGESEAESS
ncbi:hypothetical protein BJX70DRAFT_237824 [Aspergillus crustosus]